jgi:hypothetical protein
MLPRDRGVSTYVLILIVAAVLAAFLAIFVLVERRGPAPRANAAASLTAEEKAYFPLLEFSDARVSAAQNFLGDTVTYLDARVTNKGTKVVRRLDVQLEFVDTLDQVVLRETAHPINARTPPLQPGQSRDFRVTFEHLPIDWNQAVPRMTPTLVQF